jgi:hypothetical protein
MEVGGPVDLDDASESSYRAEPRVFRFLYDDDLHVVVILLFAEGKVYCRRLCRVEKFAGAVGIGSLGEFDFAADELSRLTVPGDVNLW